MSLSIQNKKILITGGSGFLGRHIAHKLKEHNQVVLASRNNEQNNQASRLTGCQSIPLDVTNIESVRDGINLVKPDIIIHAAATKYVDLSEKFPTECSDVNVLGSQNVARVAIDKGVDIVIGISTDKASPPCANTYAMSKALMERTFCALNNPKSTKFTNVRFGNLAWSTGSVFPIWKKNDGG
jgi:UDP-N-acetylglucosamine 4,6-dehydratase